MPSTGRWNDKADEDPFDALCLSFRSLSARMMPTTRKSSHSSVHILFQALAQFQSPIGPLLSLQTAQSQCRTIDVLKTTFQLIAKLTLRLRSFIIYPFHLLTLMVLVTKSFRICLQGLLC